MSRRNNRGIALISTFLFVGLLFMMAASMVVVSRSRVFTGISQYHQTQAFYLAEAGLAKAMVALENDVLWNGIDEGVIDGMPGHYTVKLDDTDKYGSVVNIGGDAAKDSYRGTDTVPMNTAVLVVTANVSGHEYTLEALVRGQGSTGYMSDAILTSGKIQSKGDFHIDGISGLDDDTPVDGSIQSNLSSGSGLVSWLGDPGDTAYITGNVGTGASLASSIDMTGATIVGGQELNATHQIPNYDIANEVSSNMAHAAPTFEDGSETELTGGKYSISGDTVVNGDIVLRDGAELYINGDFEVIGSIKGEGKIWINGDTSFKGDASVNTGNTDQRISLFAEGNVKLTGFDGTEYMQALEDDDIEHLIAVAEQAVKEFQDGVDADPSLANLEFQRDSAGVVLGLHLEGSEPGEGDQVTYEFPTGGLGDNGNVLGQLRDKIDALPESESQQFVSQRLAELHRMFSSADDIEEDDPDVNFSETGPMDQFAAGDATHAAFDSVIGLALEGEPGADELISNMINLLDTVNYDKPGASYFQGAIYTKGFFYADNEVNVLGAIMVDGDGIDEETFNRKVFNPSTMGLEDGDPITLKSGDCYLGNRTRVTYVEEFFKDDNDNNSGPQNLARQLWMGR